MLACVVRVVLFLELPVRGSHDRSRCLTQAPVVSSQSIRRGRSCGCGCRRRCRTSGLASSPSDAARGPQSSLINALVPKSTTFSTKQPLQAIPNGWQRYREQRDTRYRDDRRKGVSYTAMLALVHTEERLREGVLACLKLKGVVTIMQARGKILRTTYDCQCIAY